MLIISAVNIVRFFASFQIPALELNVPIWYFTLTGALWSGVCLALSIGLYTGRQWASKLTSWLSFVYVAWYWLDRILFVKTDYARGSTIAAIGTTILGLGFVLWTVLRSNAASYFQETST